MSYIINNPSYKCLFFIRLIIMGIAMLIADPVIAKEFESQTEILEAINDRKKVFTLEEVASIEHISFENDFQKKLTQIVAYSRTADEEGLKRAISIGEKTLSSNGVEGWKKQLVQIQIVFLYQLRGDNSEQEKGIDLAIELLERDGFVSLNQIDDRFVKKLLRWNRHSQNTLQDVLLEKVGYHYLDEKQQLEEAKRYFTKIKSAHRRKKNLDQISMRLGKTEDISRVVSLVAPTRSELKKGTQDSSRANRKQAANSLSNERLKESKTRNAQYVTVLLVILILGLLFFLFKKKHNESL